MDATKNNWFMRLVKKLISGGKTEHEAKQLAAGTSKHGRSKTKPHNWRAKRKAARKMSDKSRKRNRR